MRKLSTLLGKKLITNTSCVVRKHPKSNGAVLTGRLKFRRTGGNNQILITALLTRSRSHLFRFLSALDFFSSSGINTRVRFIDTFSALRGRKLSRIIGLLQHRVDHRGTAIVIISNLLGTHSGTSSRVSAGGFVSRLRKRTTFTNYAILFLADSHLSSNDPRRAVISNIVRVNRRLCNAHSIHHVRLHGAHNDNTVANLRRYRVASRNLIICPHLRDLCDRPSTPSDSSLAHVPDNVNSLSNVLNNNLRDSDIALVVNPSKVNGAALNLGFLTRSAIRTPNLRFNFCRDPRQLQLGNLSLNVSVGNVRSDNTLAVT